MRCFILAAGYGRRLAPLTLQVPKVLVLVAGVPMLDRLLAYLLSAGVNAFAMNTHHLREAVHPHLALLQSAFPEDVTNVMVFNEPALLGTGGGVVNAAPFWSGAHMIVWNGDILADLDLKRLYQCHVAGGALATLVTQERESASGLHVDESGRICGINSPKRQDYRLLFPPEGAVRRMAFNGISVLSPQLLKAIRRPGSFDLVDGLLDVIAKGGLVRAHDMGDSFWGTTGEPERLRKLEEGLNARPALLARWTPHWKLPPSHGD